MRDFRLLPLCKLIPRSFETSRSVDCQFLTDVSELPVGCPEPVPCSMVKQSKKTPLLKIVLYTVAQCPRVFLEIVDLVSVL